MKIAEIIKKLPKETKAEYLELLDRDFNFTGPAKELWDAEPVLQKAWPRKQTFVSSFATYRKQVLGKSSK